MKLYEGSPTLKQYEVVKYEVGWTMAWDSFVTRNQNVSRSHSPLPPLPPFSRVSAPLWVVWLGTFPVAGVVLSPLLQAGLQLGLLHVLWGVGRGEQAGRVQGQALVEA